MPLLSAGGGAAGDPVPIGMPNCPTSCGGVEVPYPFGIGPDASCYLPGFNLTCDDTSSSGESRLLLDAAGTLQLLDIPDVEIHFLYAQHSGDIKIGVDAHGSGNGTFLGHGPYTLDSGNELTLTGCNVQATVKDGNITVASCTSLCQYRVNYNYNYNNEDNDEEEETQIGSVVSPCSGSSTGCCRADIVVPELYDNQVYTSGRYVVQLRWFGWNRSADLEVLPVRVFVAGKGWFDNSSVYTDLLQTRRAPSKDTMAVPIWLAWGAVGHPSSSVCKSNHSERLDGTRRGAYTCICKNGYDGNPYLVDGCKDINECKDEGQTSTGCYGECINTEGSSMCRCPRGTMGNHSIPGGKFSYKSNLIFPVTHITIAVGGQPMSRGMTYHKIGMKSDLQVCPISPINPVMAMGGPSIPPIRAVARALP
uniref:Uncharacterized protein n=1 Tax=Avena sativa TaxID=4498 RepID=A0ACD5V6Y5_AVESA